MRHLFLTHHPADGPPSPKGRVGERWVRIVSPKTITPKNKKEAPMRRTRKKMNIGRSIALVLAALLLSALMVPSLSVPVAAAESGTCGEKLAWHFSAGTLTISGTGAMQNFSEAKPAPWYSFRDQIYRISLPEGLRTIGILAFSECSNLQTVYIPDSVTQIGKYAFYECTGMESVYIGNAVSKIGPSAFYNCKSLVSVRFPEGLQVLGDQAFYRCDSLTAVTLPAYITDMGRSVFAYCTNLLQVEVIAEVSTLPEWTFYGCEQLSVVVLPQTIEIVDEYAFKECNQLSKVYFSGPIEKAQSIQESLVADIPDFENHGEVNDGRPSQSMTFERTDTNDDGIVIKTETTLLQSKDVTAILKTEHAQSTHAASGMTDAEFIVVVQSKDAWEETQGIIIDALKSLNESCVANKSSRGDTNVVLYVQIPGGVDSSLVEAMAGRDVKMTILSQNGSETRMECEDLVIEEPGGVYDYSHNVKEAPADKKETLGTEDCFELTFDQSANINSEVVVQLPQVQTNSNAYLYQVEEDGSLTRVQASVVDNKSNAHFYLGAVDKDTQYLVGVNVPGEDPSDAIIPDELHDQYGGAIENIQKIEYAITGRQSSWGLSALQVTWLLLGVLAACAILVGVVMAIWNQRRLKRGYVPDLSEYEDGDDAPAGA